MTSYYRKSGKPLQGLTVGQAFAAASRGRYVFTIDAAVKASDVGQSPEGERLDLQYGDPEPSAITTDPDLFLADWWAGHPNKDRKPILQAIATLFGGFLPPLPLPPGDYERLSAFRQLDPDSKLFVRAPNQRILYDQIRKMLGDLPLEWFGFDGRIISGSDWLLVRNDAVAVFSGRLTLRSSDPDEGLIDATISSVVDITPAGTPRAAAFANVQKGQNANPLPLLLSVVFDVAGAAEAWAPARIIKQAAGFWKYERLTQAQFVAIGEASVDQSPFNPINNVHLDVYELRRQ
jgi:hypothetical protein